MRPVYWQPAERRALPVVPEPTQHPAVQSDSRRPATARVIVPPVGARVVVQAVPRPAALHGTVVPIVGYLAERVVAGLVGPVRQLAVQHVAVVAVAVVEEVEVVAVVVPEQPEALVPVVKVALELAVVLVALLPRLKSWCCTHWSWGLKWIRQSMTE